VSRTRPSRTKNSTRNSNRSPTFSTPHTTRLAPKHVHEHPPSAGIRDRHLNHPLIPAGAGDQDPSDRTVSRHRGILLVLPYRQIPSLVRRIRSHRQARYGCIETHVPLARLAGFGPINRSTCSILAFDVPARHSGKSLHIVFPQQHEQELCQVLECAMRQSAGSFTTPAVNSAAGNRSST
jgi:hypothetical protein